MPGVRIWARCWSSLRAGRITPSMRGDGWIAPTDYTLVIYTRLDGASQPSVGRGPCEGRFRLWVRSGKSRDGRVAHSGERAHDEA